MDGCRRTVLVLWAAGCVAILAASAARAYVVGEGQPGVLEAWFARRSYAPGDLATLRVSGGAAIVGVQVLRAGASGQTDSSFTLIQGASITDEKQVRPARDREFGQVGIRIHHWPSGLYFVRVRAGGRSTYAPFVLRAPRLGYRRVAVILPTNTWQAYNRRDDNGDGVGDTWYESDTVSSVTLGRPFLKRGVPPHFHAYDLGFLRWIERTGRQPDFLSDDDLETIRSGDQLSRAYDLVIFPGHEEYVTPHAYDVVERYRDLGGNLVFLSANNFFYRVERGGDSIVRTGRWRDVGRPEARLVGAGYVGWNENVYPNSPYVVAGAELAPWLFEGTGLDNGDRFGSFGIEIDALAADSPPGTAVLARITDAFGAGRSAEMTYYSTSTGAKVFAAGALDFGGNALLPPVSTILANLWQRLAQP